MINGLNIKLFLKDRLSIETLSGNPKMKVNGEDRDREEWMSGRDYATQYRYPKI